MIHYFRHFRSLLLVVVCLAAMGLVACGQDKAANPDATLAVEQPPNRTPSAGNSAPSVEASARLTRAAILQLNGSVSDETLPGGDIVIEWTKLSGPGDVEFADPSVANTTATFTQAGTYLLRLTATDGELTATDDLTVVVEP